MPQLELFPPATSWVALIGFSTASFVGCMKLWTYLKGRKSRRAADRELVTTLRSEVEELRSEAAKKNDELVWLRRERSTAIEEEKVKNDTLTQLRGELAGMKNRFKELEIALENSHRQYQTLVGQFQRQSKDMKAVTDEAQRLKFQHSQALDLLKTRTSELRGAQAFLTKADSLSGADVIAMVEGLNTEVSQTAAFMADSFEFQKPQSGEEERQHAQEAHARASEILGERTTHLLKWSDHTDDPMLIQIAFQSTMLGFSEWLMESWYFEEPENDHFLQEIFGRIRESGEFCDPLLHQKILIHSSRGTSRCRKVASTSPTSCPPDGPRRIRDSRKLDSPFNGSPHQHSDCGRMQTIGGTNPRGDHDAFHREIDRHSKDGTSSPQGGW